MPPNAANVQGKVQVMDLVERDHSLPTNDVVRRQTAAVVFDRFEHERAAIAVSRVACLGLGDVPLPDRVLGEVQEEVVDVLAQLVQDRDRIIRRDREGELNRGGPSQKGQRGAAIALEPDGVALVGDHQQILLGLDDWAEERQSAEPGRGLVQMSHSVGEEGEHGFRRRGNGCQLQIMSSEFVEDLVALLVDQGGDQGALGGLDLPAVVGECLQDVLGALDRDGNTHLIDKLSFDLGANGPQRAGTNAVREVLNQRSHDEILASCLIGGGVWESHHILRSL